MKLHGHGATRRALGVLLALVMSAHFTAGCSDETSTKEWDIKNPDAHGEADTQSPQPDAQSEEPDTNEPPGEEPTPHAVPVSVETILSASTVSAGTRVTVTCQLLDADGNPAQAPAGARPRLVYAPQQSFLEPEELTLTPTTAGQASIACQLPSLSLIDDTPALLTIEPGAPFTVVTNLDRYQMTAGDTAAATCEVFDAFGNRVEGAATYLTADSSGSDVQINNLDVRITRSGIHHIACTVDGAAEEFGQYLEVNPGLPAHLAASKVPDQAFYDTGQVVEIATIVTDEFGNVIEDARVSFHLLNPRAGENHSFGHGKFRFEKDGIYNVAVAVDPPTLNDAPLTANIEIKVNGQGPSIECVSPANAVMLDAAPGSTVTFRGRVSDAHGIGEVKVNGTSVLVGADGTFQSSITTRFGINFVNITATDAVEGGYGKENSTTCAFLAANKWGNETTFMSDAVSLWLGQSAVDDRNASGPINSLNDVLYKVLNSQGLKNQLHSALSAANPLWEQCINLGFTRPCARVTYQSMSMSTSNTTALTLISNGLRLQATIKNIKLNLGGTVSGSLSVRQLDAQLDVDLALRNGRPTITLRPASVQTNSQGVVIQINGLPDWVGSGVSSLIQGTLQNLVESQVESFLKNQLQDTLDSLVAGLDISSLGSSFNVPRLDGSGTVDLSFGVNFSSLGVTAARALFGLGLKFTATPSRRATPSLGFAMPVGDNLLTTDPGKPIAAGVHIGTLNHVLHSLWRGGLFDATLSSGAIGTTFPEGTVISMNTALPPVVELNGPEKLRLMLGGVRMSILYPGLFDEPIEMWVGAVANSGVSIHQSGSDSSLHFSSIQIGELHFSPIDISLDEYSRSVLESFLRGVLQNVIDTSLNNALPALPIPSFTIPPDLSTYGLPGGSALGIVNPQLGGGGRHFQIKGNFGVLP